MVLLVSQSWLDVVVVLITFLLLIVHANEAPWHHRPGKRALRTLFPRWLKVMRFAAEVSWSANRSRA